MIKLNTLLAKVEHGTSMWRNSLHSYIMVNKI